MLTENQFRKAIAAAVKGSHRAEDVAQAVLDALQDVIPLEERESQRAIIRSIARIYYGKAA